MGVVLVEVAELPFFDQEDHRSQQGPVRRRLLEHDQIFKCFGHLGAFQLVQGPSLVLMANVGLIAPCVGLSLVGGRGRHHNPLKSEQEEIP